MFINISKIFLIYIGKIFDKFAKIVLDIIFLLFVNNLKFITFGHLIKNHIKKFKKII